MAVWIMLAFVPISWIGFALMVHWKTAYENTGNNWYKFGAGILGLGMPVAAVLVFNVLPY